MKSMTRDEYFAALHQMIGRTQNPTIEQIMTVCPHLTEEQVTDMLMTGKSEYFALPPVKIKGSYLIASYNVGGEKYPAYFDVHGYSHRTRASYADGKLKGDIDSTYRYMDEAMAYAETHWPEELILDDWLDFLRIHVADPTDLVRGSSQFSISRPKHLFTIGIGLSRQLNDYINDHSAPEWVHMEAAIAVASIDPFEAAEIKGGRGGYDHWNCAYCGGGILLTSCHGCGTEFPDDHMRMGQYTPLSPKLIKLLKDAGHTFGLDPERLLSIPA